MAAFRKLVNLFRSPSENGWEVKNDQPEQTLSRATVNMFDKDADGSHTFTEYKNSVRNPENRGIFGVKKAPFNEIVAAERQGMIDDQRKRIRDEVLEDCEGSKLFADTGKPKHVLNMDAKDIVTFGGNCDAGMGKVHKGETNEFDACGSRDVYHAYGTISNNFGGMKVKGSKTMDHNGQGCNIATSRVGEDAHFRTIMGNQRGEDGKSYTIIPNRAAAPTLVHLREGQAIGDVMTQFHQFEGVTDERMCSRYGYMCGYEK